MTCVPAHMLLVHLFVETTHTFPPHTHTHYSARVDFRPLLSNKLRLDAHIHVHKHTQHGQTKSQTDNEQLAL